jgi:acyl transferase domain-containing protein
MTSRDAATTSADTLRRAYLAIEALQRQLDQYERARREPIAVIGIGCRFPGGVVDADSYWRVLSTGTDAVSPIPPDRWDVEEFYDSHPQRPGRTTARAGGFLDHIDRFDHEFFGISRDEALAMDPQQRLALEVVWEALEHAGHAPTALAGSRTGVFAAVCTNDFAVTRFRQPLDITPYTSAGTAHSAVPGRISYALDLRGPSVAVDTACSSALVALHLAGQSLRSGECDLAVAGGVNVIMSPLTSIAFSQLPGIISPEGHCKTFDAAADGSVPGEGCGFVVLKRLRDAVRDDDRVLAVLLGAAVNQNGRGSGLTVPSGPAQRDVLRYALQASGVTPEDVSYIEVHGSGTALGDPIEVEALTEVYGRAAGMPLLLGSAKTNIGHLQAAAGIAGLIKVVLSLAHGLVPANLNLKTINPDISFAGTTFAVPTGLTPWPAPPGRRIAAVSSFGFTGTNAHLLVGEAPARSSPQPDARRPRSVLALSAKTGTALATLARRYADRLALDDPAPLADICYSANTGRGQFRHRLAAVGENRSDVADQLRAFAERRPGQGPVTGQAADPDVVFLFSGEGCERVGMAQALYRTQPTFQRVLDECDEILRPLLDRSLLSAIHDRPDDPRPGLPAVGQPALFAVEYALATLWRAWGVEPAAVAGYGLGEYTAACVAGVMSLPDALRLVAERARPVAVNSVHSGLAGPAPAALGPQAERMSFGPPRIPLVCNLTGALWPWDRAVDAGYWCRPAGQRVRFAEGVATLRGLGYRAFLEVGPAPTLIELIAASGPVDGEVALLPSIGPDDEWPVLLSTLARLYTRGVPVDWAGFDRDYRRDRVDVPTYPFEPTPCWQATPTPTQGGDADDAARLAAGVR